MSKWFVYGNEIGIQEGKNTVFIFPYVGGGASSFRNWGRRFKNSSVHFAQCSGRESRFSEKAIRDIRELVEKLFRAMKTVSDFTSPYYLFEHSAGTEIACELALKIKKNGLPNLEDLIISAGRASCYRESNPIYRLDDDGFIEGLRGHGRTPDEILDNKDLISIFLPTLRADFIIDEDYQDGGYKKADNDILGLMGTIDKEMSLEEMIRWGEYTTKNFTYEYIEGEHMSINTPGEDVIKELRKYIND